MDLTSLTAISPVDGRYRRQCVALDKYFSEFALIRYRVKVEVEYFIALCQMPLPQLQGVGEEMFAQLRKVYNDFTVEDAAASKKSKASPTTTSKLSNISSKSNSTDSISNNTRNSSTSVSPLKTSTTHLCQCRSKTHWTKSTTHSSSNSSLPSKHMLKNGKKSQCWLAPTVSLPHRLALAKK